MDKSKLLDQCGALGEDRTLLARGLDRAKQASERNIPAATDFLSPAQQAHMRPGARRRGPRPGPPGPRPPLRERKSAAHERNALSSHGLPPQYFRRGGA